MPEPTTPPVVTEPPADPPTHPAGTPPADPDGVETDGVETDPDGAEALGDPGKRALDSMKAKLATEKAAKKALQDKLDALSAPKPGDELSPEQIKAAAKAEAMAELRAPLFQTQAKSAALALGFNDPADALLLLSATDFEVGSDGTFDAEELNDKLSDVLAAKPYLAKNNPAGQPGDPAPRTVAPAKAGGSPKSPTIDERIAKARADGDVDLQISLQNMKLANASR